MFPAETISLNQIVEILKEAIEAVENEDLKNKLLQIKNKCTATKTVKWKKRVHKNIHCRICTCIIKTFVWKIKVCWLLR
uniref:Uncharacterized protein n=1 Tax=Pieris brassicae granulosis virus TaxID=10465 RepID=A0A7G9U8T0_GVPB|nr:hypothetical protein [Pieris brassicae granulovirus]